MKLKFQRIKEKITLFTQKNKKEEISECVTVDYTQYFADETLLDDLLSTGHISNSIWNARNLRNHICLATIM